EEVIHRSVPDVVRSLLKPGLFQQLYRLLVDRPGSHAFFDLGTPSSVIARRHSLYVQRAAPIHSTRIFFSSAVGYNLYLDAGSLADWDNFGLFAYCSASFSSTDELRSSWTSAPGAIGPAVGNCLRRPFVGIEGRGRQSQLLADLRRKAVPEWLRNAFLLLLLLWLLLQIHCYWRTPKK
ncbi:hypothetical protein V1524DRAFT_432261, partial [Lipomyces starkeyi]